MPTSQDIRAVTAATVKEQTQVGEHPIPVRFLTVSLVCPAMSTSVMSIFALGHHYQRQTMLVLVSDGQHQALHTMLAARS